MPCKRFRIAFSFAGEKRGFVKEAAAILAERFGEASILYDKYHEAEFAVYDLGIRLPKLYGEESDLIVPVLCPNYDEKRWTGWEWVHIYGLLTKVDGHRVMPSRFKHANADGLTPTSGFIELDDKTPEQFATLILERLALNEGHPKDHFTKPAAPSPAPRHISIPHNLPRLGSFFGREDELKKIAEALDSENRSWGALIDGPGGMGKTSLAIRAAHECPADQFLRIVFVSVKDRELDDDGVRYLGNLLVPGFLEMLNELARELGQPEIAKSPENERVRLLLDALRPAQALLILDNLESLSKPDRDQLFTFVKRLPQGCKAILTSRRRIGSGSEELILEKLSQQAALDTLAELATRNPLLAKTSKAERIALYNQTAGKPLLLRWMAGQLGRGRCRTFTDALQFLRSCPPDNNPLEFIFGDLVEDFTPEETEVLCSLTYFTLPAKVEHIAGILAAGPTSSNLSEEDIESALASLANRSLVVPDEEGKTHSLVPMVADFLRRAKPEVVAETGTRLEMSAYDLTVENGYDTPSSFQRLDAAWPLLASALPLFFGGANERLQTVCHALRVFLEFTGRWDEWYAISRDAEAKALKAESLMNAGWRAFDMGIIHYLRRESAEVLACADRADTYWREIQAATRELATAIRLRGIGHELGKDYPAAIEAYRKSIEMHRSLGPESVDMAIGLNDLGEAEFQAGNLEAAEQDYQEALRIARMADHHECVASFTGNLAALALARENWSDAETLANDALTLAETVGRQELISDNNYRLAKALARQGRRSEGLPHARTAVEIYEKLDHPDLTLARQILAECEGQAT